MNNEDPAAWAAEEAERLLGQRNPRFLLYRHQDPAHGQFEVDWLAAALIAAEQRGREDTAVTMRAIYNLAWAGRNASDVRDNEVRFGAIMNLATPMMDRSDPLPEGDK